MIQLYKMIDEHLRLYNYLFDALLDFSDLFDAWDVGLLGLLALVFPP